MKKFFWYLIIFTLVFSLAACTGNTNSDAELPNQEEQNNPIEEQPNNEGKNDVDDKDVPVEPDQQIEETIEIEGMKEKITLNLYNPGILNFRTYIPSDFIAEEASSGEGDGFWFYSNFEGKKQENVYLHFYFFSENIKEEPNIDDKDSTFAIMLEGLEPIFPEDKYYDWSIKEFASPNSAKYAALGEHNDQYFVVIQDYPYEYADGMGPRINKVIEHFYWTDTEEYLSK